MRKDYRSGFLELVFLSAVKVKFKKVEDSSVRWGTVFISTITQVGVLPVSPVSNRTNRQ